MSEVMIDVPDTNTKLKFDTDRPWDRTTGDAVMRVLGHGENGESVRDSVYVEVSADEARLLALILRESQAPTPRTRDEIAQNVLGAFSKLSGQDAGQIAQIATRANWLATQRALGIPESEAQDRVEGLAERFERASAKQNSAASFAGGGNGESSDAKAGRY